MTAYRMEVSPRVMSRLRKRAVTVPEALAIAGELALMSATGTRWSRVPELDWVVAAQAWHSVMYRIGKLPEPRQLANALQQHNADPKWVKIVRQCDEDSVIALLTRALCLTGSPPSEIPAAPVPQAKKRGRPPGPARPRVAQVTPEPEVGAGSVDYASDSWLGSPAPTCPKLTRDMHDFATHTGMLGRGKTAIIREYLAAGAGVGARWREILGGSPPSALSGTSAWR